MSFSIPNPFYEAAKKLFEARMKQEIAKMKATSKGCGSGCGHRSAAPQFRRPMDRTDQPGLHKLLNEVPTKTGIVYINGQLHSVQPPGTNPTVLMAAGMPEVRPGESATYSSAADHVHFAGGCPHCGLTRGLDGNLYDAKGIITTNITTGCIPCGCDDNYGYNCEDGVCVFVNGGTYATLEECQEACAWWYCNEGICEQDYELGTYETEAECELECCECLNVSAYRNTGHGYEVNELDQKWGGKTCVATPGPWNNDPSPSRWISTGGEQASSTEPCNGTTQHNYSMTFTVTELPAELCFRFLADDNADIILNGSTLETGMGGYTTWTDYSVNQDDGLVVGTNILTFVVNDTACSLTGLRVEFCPDGCSGWYCCEENDKVVPLTDCASKNAYGCSCTTPTGCCVCMGTGGTFVAPCTGQLYFLFNDDNYADNTDNTAGWTVTFAGIPYTVSHLNCGTEGPMVTRGQSYSYNATGTLEEFNNSGNDWTPTGRPETPGGHCGSCALFSLVGVVVGDDCSSCQ